MRRRPNSRRAGRPRIVPPRVCRQDGLRLLGKCIFTSRMLIPDDLHISGNSLYLDAPRKIAPLAVIERAYRGALGAMRGCRMSFARSDATSILSSHEGHLATLRPAKIRLTGSNGHSDHDVPDMLR